MVDGLIGALAYWAIGWALAYGPGSNGFIGESNFFRYLQCFENLDQRCTIQISWRAKKDFDISKGQN
jgi:hypothetical protein